MTSTLPDLRADLRAQFPQLASGLVYFDNAAGGLMPRRVIDAISAYLTTHGSINAMPPFPLGRAVLDLKARARAATALFLNAEPGEVALGPSASALTFRLAGALARLWGSGDEVIISELEHEANASPWRELARVGVSVRVWRARWPEGRLDLDDLRALLSPATRLVALTAASNALGLLTPVAEAAQAAREAGAWSMVDAVHAAPHLLPNVQDWGVDFAVFSPYKVFGPHLGAMYIKAGLLSGLPFQKLSFVPDGDITQLEHGTAQYELWAGWLASLDYLRELGGAAELSRAGLEAAYRRIQELEAPIAAALVDGLNQLPNVQVYGSTDLQARVGTVGFRVAGLGPMAAAERLAEAGVSVGAGHFYATLPMAALGLLPDGVVRASIAHYTSLDDVERLLAGVQALGTSP